MTRILIVERDESETRKISKSLSEIGIDYITAGSAEEAITKVNRYTFDLFIISVELPRINGFTFAKIMKEKTCAPIIFTSSADSEAQKIFAFDLGADDFLVKPFGMLELSCRIRAILNRCQKPRIMNIGAFNMNYEEHTVDIDGKLIYLSNIEFRLLNELILANGKTVSKTSLIRNVWGDESAANDNTLKERIRTLRKKIGRDRIKSVHGNGYRFVSEKLPFACPMLP